MSRLGSHPAVQRLLSRGVVLVVAQDLSDYVAFPPPAGVVIEPFAGCDWGALAPITTAAERRAFRRRAAAERCCLVAWDGARPIGYTWTSPAMEAAIEGFELPLPPGACYGWNLFVAPEARSRGIGSALVGARLRWAETHGYRESWRVVAPHNLASVRTIERAAGGGCRVIGLLRYVRVGRWFRGALGPVPAEHADLASRAEGAGAAA